MAAKKQLENHLTGNNIDKMTHAYKQHKAFTLIEVMITMAVFIIIIEAIYTTVIVSQRSLNNYAKTTAPKQNLRGALAAMVKELRESKNIFIVKSQKYGEDDQGITLTFQRPVYGDIKYTWENTGDDAGKIMRTNYSNKTVLAYNITSLVFTAPSTNEIIIDITDGDKGAELELKEKVVLRNQSGIFQESQNATIK